jgi:hypothetical protein
MKRTDPPYLLDCLLLFLLSPRDRETVSGDLYEEFLDVKLPELGQFRAHLWYMGQVLSFVPGRIEAVLLQGYALRLLCVCTALAGGWLGMMDILLRHPGYKSQIVIAATIVSQAALTLAALRFHRYRRLRAIAMVGSAAILWLAGIALKATIGGAHLEGYVLLIALALIVQAVLTVLTMPRANRWLRGHRTDRSCPSAGNRLHHGAQRICREGI